MCACMYICIFVIHTTASDLIILSVLKKWLPFCKLLWVRIGCSKQPSGSEESFHVWTPELSRQIQEQLALASPDGLSHHVLGCLWLLPVMEERDLLTQAAWCSRWSHGMKDDCDSQLAAGTTRGVYPHWVQQVSDVPTGRVLQV